MCVLTDVYIFRVMDERTVSCSVCVEYHIISYHIISYILVVYNNKRMLQRFLPGKYDRAGYVLCAAAAAVRYEYLSIYIQYIRMSK